MRIGVGYDVHRLISGRPLVLGGVAIPFKKGLEGHSDADVLLHAICDALLGAAGAGDIGMHFPDTDPNFKDVDSVKLLNATVDIIRTKGLGVSNIDATIFAEEPKLHHYREEMQRNIAQTIGIELSCVNIKATTTEGLGTIGKGEGIAAMCVTLLMADTKKL
jgi:2-C-methyl-D-erythritol 2,4-cyclodiphosphate synthase